MILTAIVALAQAPVAAAGIAPPLGEPLTLVTEEVRGDGRDVRRYRLERTLLFTAEHEGFRVTMTLTGATADGDDTRRRMFAASNAALLGRPIVIHLDQRGGLRSVDDLGEVWRLWMSGLLGATQPDRERRDIIDPLTARLQRTEPGEQQRLIAATVTTLVVPGDERAPSPPRGAQVAVAGVALSGTLLSAAEGELIVSRLSAQSAPTEGMRVTLTSERKVDPRSGLVVAQRRTERRTTSAGRSLTTEITIALSPR